MKKPMIRILLCFSLVLLLSGGCLKTPELEYVSNKEGLGNLISNKAADDEGILITKQVNALERVDWDCEDAEEEVGIHAEVILPEVTAVPIWQLEHKELNSDLLEFYARTIFEGDKIRNSGAIYTKDVVDHQVDYMTEFLERGCLSDGTPLDEHNIISEDGEQSRSERIREYIQLLYKNYDELPEEPEYGEAVDYSFYLEEYDLGYTDSDLLLIPYEFEYAGVTGLYNDKEYTLTLQKDSMNTGICFALDSFEKTVHGYDYRCISYSKNENNSFAYCEEESTCEIHKEEAVLLCQDFLTQLEIENMEAEEPIELDLWERGQDAIMEINYLGNKAYLILFHRSYNDLKDIAVDLSVEDILNQQMSIPNIAWDQFMEQFPYEEVLEQGSSAEERFILKSVPELAAFLVTDDGITYAWIQNLMEEQGCLAENVKLLDFAQVERQAEAHFQSLYTDSEKKVVATFVELNYAAMRSPDREGEYILIPVWDFRHGNKVYVSINAIDGTVFNRQQGY